MTNLIEKVAELREMATTDIPGKYTSDCPEYDYMVGVLNAAPKLLDILGKIQAGDAEILEETIIFLNRNGHARQDVIGMLYRLSDLARLMERPLNDIQCAESPRTSN